MSEIINGCMVVVINDDGDTEESFIGLVGVVVENRGGTVGIDFGKRIGCDTWRLDDDILPEQTGRYYYENNIEIYKPYAVELI